MIYVLEWTGNGPCVAGVFSSPWAAVIHLNEDAKVRWFLDKPYFDRWEILDTGGGKTHYVVQGYHIDRMAR